MAMIACVDLDPFLVGLIQRVRPADEVVELPAEALADGRLRRHAAVVMAANSAATASLAGTPLAKRTALVAERRDGAVPATHPGPVLRRPVDATELQSALAQLVPEGWLARWERRVRALAGSATIDGAFGVARVGAVSAASVLALTNPLHQAAWLPIVAVAAWMLLRMWVRQSTVILVAIDALLTVAVIVATTGTDSPFLLLAAVVAAEVGYSFSPATGATVIGAGTLTGLVPLSFELARGASTATDLVAWGALIPMASGIGVLAHRMQESRETGNVQLLTELHATLDQLAKQAYGVAGTLEVSSVAERVLTRLRSEVGAVGGILLVGDGPVQDVVATMGLADGAPARIVVGSGRAAPLPPEVEILLPEGDRLEVPMRALGLDRGSIVAVLPTGRSTREAERRLRTLATETAIALENARLFESIRELTVDSERRRLARELHDGVIQSLVHVRFELDLVGRVIEDPHADDLRRLREVVGQAVDEVRSTVNDLQSVRLSAGLGTALLSVGREYDRPGLRVVVDAGPVESLALEAELQLLRIAQEAISNAVHHGKPTVVYVRLWEEADRVSLQILDDGVGFQDAPEEAGRGVGLRAMQERAELLGAQLDLGPGAGGGTCVQVDVPMERKIS